MQDIKVKRLGAGEEAGDVAAGSLPRLLVLDITQKGNGTATGQLKKNIFASWPDDLYLQIYSKGKGALGVQHGARERATGYSYAEDFNKLMQAVNEFQPQLILYRPVPDAPELHAIAMHIIEAQPDIPLVTWIMDDWPARLESDDPKQFAGLHKDWLWLLERSALRLSICERMSIDLAERYGYDFLPFANGIQPDDWPLPKSASGSGLTIRYAGALADNMTARSVLRVAEAVEGLAQEGHDVRLEIRTNSIWKDNQQRHYVHLSHTSIDTKLLSDDDYRNWLRGADAVMIAYNFDAQSLRYIGLSMANKLPECLASGSALLAHGPHQAATIAYVIAQDCALVVDEPDAEQVKAGILRLFDKNFREQLACRGREVAFGNHDINEIRNRFISTMVEAAKPAADLTHSDRQADAIVEYPRSAAMSVDETKVIANLLRECTGRSNVMFDIGAHVGTSAAYFADLGWTVYCFEPDDSNRAKLSQKFRRTPNVIIDRRAIGAEVEVGKPFYESEESTGIGSLHAFHATHRQASLVDVTTVSEVAKQHHVEEIGFLKIDVEGLDYAVLKGVPWDGIRPDVIECEFEDTKTTPLGHTYEDMAEFLIEKGYVVYVSEWHPIVRYGIAHDFCRLSRYPTSLKTPDAWGNLLAFRNDPGPERLREAFASCLHQHGRTEQPGGAGFDATLVILGNGPSLKGFDFERLKNFDCLGMNAAYRYWDEIKWYPRYYACLDLVVGLSHKDAIENLIRHADEYAMDLFVLRANLIEALSEDVRGSPKIVNFDELLEAQLHDAPKNITTGSHSALIAALIGYGRLALLGIDCNYVEEVKGARRAGGYVLEIAETPNDNPNYFFADYQKVGDKYNLPNPSPDLHVRSWRNVAPMLREYGLKVWNCSPISRVDAFPFRAFEEIEQEQQARREKPRTLRVDRIFAKPTQPREIQGRGFHRLGREAAWCLRTIRQRGLVFAGLVVAAMVVAVALMFFAPLKAYPWIIVGVGGLLGTLALCVLMILKVLEVVASIAAEHAELRCKRREQVLHDELEKYVREQIEIAVSKSSMNRLEP